jgi:spermidine/putrescine transport system permease protein
VKGASGRSWLRHLLAAPNLVFVVLFFFVPLAFIAAYSFGTLNIVTFNVDFGWTLDNYRSIGQSIYVQALVRSILISLAATAGCVVLGFPLAYFISRQAPRWQNVLMVAVILPFWTSFVVRTYAWTNLLQNGGPIDDAVRALGYPGHINLLYSSKAVVIGMVYSYLPLMILPIYVSLERIDKAVLDAAADLGASGRRLFRRVILPLSAPGLAAGCTVVGISATGEYIIPSILGGGKALMLGNVVGNQFNNGDYPFGSAIAMSLMSLMVVALLVVRAARRSGSAA